MRKGSLLPAVVLTTMAVLLTGCSRNPVAPQLDPSAGQGGAGSAAVGVVPDDPPPVDGGTPAERTQYYSITDEGTLTVGRWTLLIRKNSLKMPATITLRVNDPEAMDVLVQVEPAAANDFAQPVILTANTTDVPDFDYSTGTMQVWSNGNWQDPPKSTVSSHPNQQNVVGHFTTLGLTMVTNSSSKKMGA